MNVEEAKQKIEESLARQRRLSEIEAKIPAVLEAATGSLKAAQDRLANALIAFELGEATEGEVKGIRMEIRKNRTILEELPLLKKGIHLRIQGEKGLIGGPQGVIRAAAELEQTKVEYFQAKARVRNDMQLRESGNPELRESFKRRVLDLQDQAERAGEEKDYWGFVEAEGLRE